MSAQQGDGIATADGSGICEVPPQLATQSLKMTIGQNCIEHASQTHHRENDYRRHNNAPWFRQNSEKDNINFEINN